MRIRLQLLFLLVLTITILPQIRFKQYPNYSVTTSQIKELEGSELREIIMLNGAWTVYADKDKGQNRIAVSVPSVYEGDDELVFEKKFTASPEQLEKKIFMLNFLGINYAADISVNTSVLYRHTGGSFPFSVPLPKDLLKPGANANTLIIRVIPKGDERNTIPLTHSYLSPNEYAGIFRDVYITLMPAVGVQRYTVHQEYASPSRARIRVDANIVNRLYSKGDSLSQSGNYEVRLTLIPSGQLHSEVSTFTTVDVKKGREKDVQIALEVPSPLLWTPETPSLNKLKIEVLQGGTVIDQVTKSMALYSLKVLHDSVLLNNQVYQFRGVTYVPAFKGFGTMMTYDQIRQDILLIKETGFNAIRFTKVLPHPYMLQLCAEYGLLAFVDIPLDGIPAALLTDNLFFNNARNFVSQWITAYNNYSALAAVGLGSGYSGSDEGEVYFLTQMNDIIRQRSKKLTYASFLPLTVNSEVAGLDVYGIEVTNTDISELEYSRNLLEGKLGKGKILITGIGYWTTEENSNGYANPNTYEAQAKYFADLVKYTESRQLPGYFLNTMFDYRTEYTSIVGKYNPDNVIPLGLATEDRATERTGYKLIYAVLHNLQEVTVPIGVKKDKSPFVFIVFGLVLALFIGFLINSGKKFREDALRALVRPYNFFADIRDLRMFSPAQSIILGVCISCVFSLISASFLHYLKQNVLLEKVLLATTYTSIVQAVSYLAWHPTHALFFLTIFYLLLLVIAAAIIRVASMGVMNKVFYSSSFYIAVWACIPAILLTPLGIVLYRILLPQAANWYIYGVTVIFVLWLFLRILKGTFVVFDIRSSRVYFFGTAFIILLLAAVMGHLQYHYLSTDFIIHAIREFRQGL